MQISYATNTRSNLFDQIVLTHFLNQKWQYQIRCLHDQISLKQTNQIGFKEMGHFDSLASSNPAPLFCCLKMFYSLLE